MTNEPIRDEPSLFDALYEDENAVVRALRAGAQAESSDEEGTTALYLAAVQNLPEAVRLLLAAGADPDRASGEGTADLPLCGAACGGHTEVVEALLSAGARPDLREEFGFTALRWAVGLGHASTVEALLSGGADPLLPGPQGEPMLVLAAQRGSLRTVRALLEHGAGAPGQEAVVGVALAEARRAAGPDLERELLRQLEEAYGPGFDAVVRRELVDGEETVAVELLRDGVPAAGADRHTGHGEIAALLEGWGMSGGLHPAARSGAG
ncbi:ankyrin repeat domain-containing protein [Streptomyces microflavus]|uniref:Ankyrin n=1 Tax=Streptomyces microflavus DSM 40593 TaxID=1303692 RepID=N0CNR8_STRMI|nr:MULTISPECIES: ankyrin repeat domain-containing protein [Streptomyces]AGK76544.1 Ankyrin [Streptomyces microflavus DSM 40593]MCX4651720.1 ankyrin repeat domain-containing protein [Streptomyces microflavus]MDX2976416.1 ankyrin repeat domain-containing protein [Streptomyces sp. NRRL_B-2249]WSA60095.1 ankyrin repeat domain-containing protein [Streptomyces microflavus]SCK37856.1 FOG: Ankyrin repeat [Streptomyces sp. ScaeMP-e48]